MKKATDNDNSDELREEYNLAEIPGIVRGKYAERARKGSNIIVLAPDVAEAFPDAESVNEALRLLINLAKSASRRAG